MKPLIDSSSDKSSTLSQAILIQVYDIYHKVFGSRTGNERITKLFYKIWTSAEKAPILNIILCKASQHANNPTVQVIPYVIQGVTNSDIYKSIIQKQNAIIRDNSIIPVYNIDERDVGKFTKLIHESKYIQDIESTNESKQKAK